MSGTGTAKNSGEGAAGAFSVATTSTMAPSTADSGKLGSVVDTLDLLNGTLFPSANVNVKDGIDPEGLAYASSLGAFFVADSSSNTLAEVNASLGMVEQFIPTSTEPCGVAFDPANDVVYTSLFATVGFVATFNASTGKSGASISVGAQPCAIAYDPANGLVYVANSAGSSVSVVDPATGSVKATIPVGKVPLGIAVDPVTSTIYVANSGSSSLSVIHGATEAVTATVGLGGVPFAAAYDAANNHTYVVNHASNNVTVVNATTNKTIGDIPVGTEPYAVAYDGSTESVYVANYGSANVTVIQSNGKHLSVPTGTDPDGIAFDSAQNLILVADRSPDDLTIVDGATNAVSGSVPLALEPDAVEYAQASDDIYSANYVRDNVSVVDATSNDVVGSIPVGGSPDGIAFSGSTGDLYVSNAATNNVSVIDATTGKAVASITVGTSPAGLALDPASGNLFVADSGENNLTVIDTATSKATGLVPAGGGPDAISFDPANGFLYVADTLPASELGRVTIVNATSGAYVGYVTVGSYPAGIVYDPSNRFLYVSNLDSNNVTVINGTSDSVAANIALAFGPSSITYDQLTRGVYVADSSGSGVGAIDDNTNTLVGTIGLANNTGTSGFAIDSANGLIYTADRYSSALSVLDPAALPQSFSVRFAESGLPTGTPWSVSVNNTVYSAEEGAVLLGLINGTYSYDVAHVAGYLASPSSGDLIVNGSGFTITISFEKVEVLYGIDFVSNGLPKGANWSVIINGTREFAENGTTSFTEPNGTYYYNVSSPPGFLSLPSHGSTKVTGHLVTVELTFYVATYNISFDEQGLPKAANWSVNLDGSKFSSNTSVISLSGANAKPNGTYAYTVLLVHGYTASPTKANVTVKGVAVTVLITFNVTLFGIIVQEEGLARGTSWSATVNGTTLSSSGTSITFYLPNGTFAYDIATVHGYTVIPKSGTITVSGSGQLLELTFTASQPARSIFDYPEFYVAIGIMVVAVVAVLYLYMKRRAHPGEEESSEGKKESTGSEEGSTGDDDESKPLALKEGKESAPDEK